MTTAVISSPRLLTRAEAAEYLGIKSQTLACWHATGRYGIPLVRVGRSVRYRQSDLDAWMTSRTVTQSGEASD